MKYLFLAWTLCFSTVLFGQTSENTEFETSAERVYSAKDIDESPRFTAIWCDQIKNPVKCKACWNTAMHKYLDYFFKYPKDAKRNKTEGTIWVYFIVEKDGRITNVETVLGMEDGCTEEAIRVVKLMPDWVPGMKDGQPVRVLMNVEVAYDLKKK